MTKNKKSNVCLVMVTFPNQEVARQIGARLVEMQVAACVNLIPGVLSIYRWQGHVQEEMEVVALIKTTRDRLVVLEEMVVKLHPYEVPEFLVTEAAGGFAPYLEWVEQSTEKKTDER